MDEDWEALRAEMHRLEFEVLDELWRLWPEDERPSRSWELEREDFMRRLENGP